MNAINQPALIGSVASGGTPASAPRQFLAFRLGEQEFGLEAKYVQTLRHYRSLTRIADGAEMVQGVAMVDGVVMPLVDMRVSFRREPASSESLAAVIVLNLSERSVGMVVDDVSELVELGAQQIGALEHAGAGLAPGGLIGQATLGERSLILLDVERIMCAAPAAALEKRVA